MPVAVRSSQPLTCHALLRWPRSTRTTLCVSHNPPRAVEVVVIVNNAVPFDCSLPSSLFPSLSSQDDVAVIDEMQMLKDEDRGGAWTRAILGQPATSSSTYTTSNGPLVFFDPLPSTHILTLTHQAFLLGRFICVDMSVQLVS